MNVALWILAGVLAFAFVGAGVLKLRKSKEELGSDMPWVEDFSAGQVRGIGVVELLGAVGLILPALLDIAPILTPIAAAGLAITMATAVVVHLRRGDGFAAAVPSIVLGGLSLFLAIMRFGPEAF